MKKSVFISILILFPIGVFAQSQNFISTPLQAAYENESFFYQPNQFAPIDVGPLANIEPGFRTDNPLNQLAQNPAWQPKLNGHDLYAYIHVRSRNRYKSFNNPPTYNPCPYCIYPLNNIWGPVPYPNKPNLYSNANGHRLNQNPFLNVAIIGYPFKNKDIFAGITYQGMFSKEDYYAYPSFTYPQGTTSDYASTGSANMISIFQKSKLRQTGHFVTLYGGYKLSKHAVIGLRISAAIFQRNGGYGNPNKNSNNGSLIYTFKAPAVNQINANLSNLYTEQRTQHYHHLNIDLGGRYKINQRLTGMVHLGYLIGSGDENLNSSTPSYFETGTKNTGSYYSLTQSVTTAVYQWNNSGHTFNGGWALQYNMPDVGQLSLFYSTYANHTGFTPNAQSLYSFQRYTQNATVNNASEVSTTQRKQFQTGGGSENGWSNNVGLFYKGSFFRNLTIETGVQYEHYSHNMHSLDATNWTLQTFDQIVDTTGKIRNLNQSNNYQQQVNWKDHLREHRFQIPFIAQIRLFNRVEIWGGFNEQIESIKAKDNLINPNPQPYFGVYPNHTTNLTVIPDPNAPTPGYNYNYQSKRYRFTLLSGVNFDVTNNVILHFMALPLDHQYNFNRVYQTNGLIWQAGISIYP